MGDFSHLDACAGEKLSFGACVCCVCKLALHPCTHAYCCFHALGLTGAHLAPQLASLSRRACQLCACSMTGCRQSIRCHTTTPPPPQSSAPVGRGCGVHRPERYAAAAARQEPALLPSASSESLQSHAMCALAACSESAAGIAKTDCRSALPSQASRTALPRRRRGHLRPARRRHLPCPLAHRLRPREQLEYTAAASYLLLLRLSATGQHRC